MSKRKVVVTTIVEIDGQPVMFTVAGETDRNPYRLARNLNETNSGDLGSWATDHIVTPRASA